MKLVAEGVTHEVRLLERSGERVQLTVDGRRFDLAIEPIGPGTFRVETAEGAAILHCVAEGDNIHVSWRGHTQVFRRETAAVHRAAAAAGTLEAPMPGRVVQVMVAVGDEVRAGQPLLILEAMKMENVVRAPRAGRLKALSVEAGARVTAGQTLVEIE